MWAGRYQDFYLVPGMNVLLYKETVMHSGARPHFLRCHGGAPYLCPHTPPGGAGLGCPCEARRAGLPSKRQNRGGGRRGRVLRSACVAELGAPFKTPVFRGHSDAARCLSEGEGACSGLLYPTCLPGLCPSHCGSCQDSGQAQCAGMEEESNHRLLQLGTFYGPPHSSWPQAMGRPPTPSHAWALWHPSPA